MGKEGLKIKGPRRAVPLVRLVVEATTLQLMEGEKEFSMRMPSKYNCKNYA